MTKMRATLLARLHVRLNAKMKVMKLFLHPTAMGPQGAANVRVALLNSNESLRCILTFLRLPPHRYATRRHSNDRPGRTLFRLGSAELKARAHLPTVAVMLTDQSRLRALRGEMTPRTDEP